eukprot:TRINITY_DN686_c0_g1_i3.p2 TRINITY_DN686_c0_g1~~TRINITY_DN686_c0_g1_i3.p2  ORF type:complete len:134 (+),score=9.42 TRINITY_DN686_c0_g1_i3:264-665(+)
MEKTVINMMKPPPPTSRVGNKGNDSDETYFTLIFDVHVTAFPVPLQELSGQATPQIPKQFNFDPSEKSPIEKKRVQIRLREGKIQSKQPTYTVFRERFRIRHFDCKAVLSFHFIFDRREAVFLLGWVVIDLCI